LLDTVYQVVTSVNHRLILPLVAMTQILRLWRLLTKPMFMVLLQVMA
jgi:hypothetical protein